MMGVALPRGLKEVMDRKGQGAMESGAGANSIQEMYVNALRHLLSELAKANTPEECSVLSKAVHDLTSSAEDAMHVDNPYVWGSPSSGEAKQ